MIANWVHIVIVHLAVIGVLWMTVRVLMHRKKPMHSKPWKHSYTGLIIVAFFTAIAYLTGPDTAEWTQQVLSSYSQELVENHALWGRVAFVIQVIIGLLGIMGWASILQEENPSRILSIALPILLAINTIIILYTAHLGGQIRRTDLVLWNP